MPSRKIVTAWRAAPGSVQSSAAPLRRLLWVLLLALVPVTVAVSPSAASASTGSGPVIQTPLRNGICDAGEFCVYRDTGRTGPIIDWNQGTDDLTYTNDSFPIVGGRVNDEASSVWNRTTCTVRVFRHSDFNDPGTQVAPGAAVNLANTPVGGDEASSHNACV